MIEENVSQGGAVSWNRQESTAAFPSSAVKQVICRRAISGLWRRMPKADAKGSGQEKVVKRMKLW
jgi:hypothetical protein